MEEGPVLDCILMIFSMCFAFLYLLEGIEEAAYGKKNRIYKITHVLYPLLMVISLIYLIVKYS